MAPSCYATAKARRGDQHAFTGGCQSGSPMRPQVDLESVVVSPRAAIRTQRRVEPVPAHDHVVHGKTETLRPPGKDLVDRAPLVPRPVKYQHNSRSLIEPGAEHLDSRPRLSARFVGVSSPLEPRHRRPHRLQVEQPPADLVLRDHARRQFETRADRSIELPLVAPFRAARVPGSKREHGLEQQLVPCSPFACQARPVCHDLPVLILFKPPYRPGLLVLLLNGPSHRVDRPESEIGVLACGLIDHGPVASRYRVSADSDKHCSVGPRERIGGRAAVVLELAFAVRAGREQMQSRLAFRGDEEPPDRLPFGFGATERKRPCLVRPEHDERGGEGPDQGP